MSSTSFYLRPTKSLSYKIYLKFNFGRKKQVRYATGYSVNQEKNWDPVKEIVKNVINEPKSLHINSMLSDLKSFCNELILDYDRKKAPLTNKIIKSQLDIFHNKSSIKVNEEKKSFFEFFDWHIKYYTNNPHPSTNKTLSSNTIRPYNTALKNLKKFSEKHGNLDFEDITLDFHETYLKYLQEQKFSNNYIGNQIKLIKAVMNSALERGLHNNLDFKKRGFHKPTEEVNNIYLSIEELEAIEKIELEDYQDRARDLFLIGAFTGLRVSDFNKLTQKNIVTKNNTTFFEINSQKSGKTIGIPIHPVVKTILKKRNGQLPKKMPDQHINRELKLIAAEAKIKDKVEIVKTIGGVITRVIHDKCDLVTNHTARRSFCTNAYLANMPVYDIMAISGHTTEKVFYNYIKITPMEHIEKLANHPFFK